MNEYIMAVREGVALWATAVIVAGLTMLGIRMRPAIDRARSRGLWPPPGQIPTESDLHRLIRIGETSLAVKMCRQIHNLGRGEAKAVVRKIARGSA